MSGEEGAQCCKVVLLGESGVGKTCIITRFINNTFDDNGMSTTGASYVGKSMSFDEYGGKSIKFDIWDTAGQEKYRALTKIFYKDASIAILVYDITRRESFDELKNYWFNQIKDYAPKNTIVAIAANKSDLFEKEQVPEAEARGFAKEIGAIFRLTSAYTAAGIEDLFRAIGSRYLDPNFVDDEKKPVASKSNEKKKNTVTLSKNNTNNKNKEKKNCCK